MNDCSTFKISVLSPDFFNPANHNFPEKPESYR
jgi:hypothetical protein